MYFAGSGRLVPSAAGGAYPLSSSLPSGYGELVPANRRGWGCLGGCIDNTAAAVDQVASGTPMAGSSWYAAKEAIATNNWSFVGDGKGEYRKVPNYFYVGEGQGNFEIEQLPIYYGWRMRRGFMWCLTIFLALLALVYVITLDRTGAAAQVEEPEAKQEKSLVLSQDGALPATPPHYMCAAAADPSIAEAAWRLADGDGDGRATLSELDRCQKQELLTGVQLAALRAGDSDGDGALSKGEFIAAMTRSLDDASADWSVAKKTWCCENHNIGCAMRSSVTTTAPPTTPAPRTTPRAARASYSKAQPPTSPPLQPPAAPTSPPQAPRPTCASPCASPCPCAVQSQSRPPVWSAGPVWAPSGGRPLEGQTTTDAPYDCKANLYHWSRDWSMPKKQWCCEREGRGCPTAPPEEAHT